ncbi:hypothetical protein [Micromonospora sp. NPDC005161]
MSMFGREAAEMLVQAIPVAIQAAVARQMDGHHAVRLQSRHAFGGGWPARYEELMAHLGEIPGAQTVKPVGKSYRIVVINNVAVLPVEYAKDLATAFDSPRALKRINKTTLELARLFGPKPDHLQPAFEGMESAVDEKGSDLLRGLQPDGIVIIYYAAHERRGLLNMGWGQISVSEKSAAKWVTAQPLPVPAATLIPGLRLLTQAGPPDAAPRFDHADLPNPVLQARTTSHPDSDTQNAEQPHNQQRSDAQH